jgi:hypothetical protein
MGMCIFPGLANILGRKNVIRARSSLYLSTYEMAAEKSPSWDPHVTERKAELRAREISTSGSASVANYYGLRELMHDEGKCTKMWKGSRRFNLDG